MIRHWHSQNISNVSLDAAGLVALADLSTIAQRTALTGTSTMLDLFVLCPGLHRQQSATELHLGEYPACAAMTTGYVFRVENQATVLYLQKVGRTGQLTTLSVQKRTDLSTQWSSTFLSNLYSWQGATKTASAAYFAAVLMTMAVLVLSIISRDWWLCSVILVLIFARFCNVMVVRHRTRPSWKGASEPGVQGDLLILLSQDRWIRLRGAVDHLKAVTSGQWLQDMTFFESCVTAVATVLVYLDAALASNTSQTGQIAILVLLIASAGLLAIANETTTVFQMHGNLMRVEGKRRTYGRRLEMAEELIEEIGRQDWAVRLGIITPNVHAKGEKEASVIM